jgi:predicted MPP superfamily phosphohydrolase
MMWIVFLVITLAFALAGAIYLWTRFHKFRTVEKLSGGRKALGWLLAAVPFLFAGIFFYFDALNTIIVLIHLAVFWLFADLAAFCLKKIRKRSDGKQPEEKRPYYAGILAAAVTFVYLAAGWYLAHHVVETDYALTTQKDLGGTRLRIAQISDSHLGTTFDGETFAAHMQRVQQTQPDLLVITGDFVDDSSAKEDMIRSCRALGEMQTPYGVYFIFGNHDKGYFHYRNFSEPELVAELEKNGVIILEDESVLIDGRFYLIGRQDRSEPSRKPMDQLVSELDKSKYMVVLDHQPNDYAAEAAAEADLVLSGHTHGGQMFPLGRVGIMIGANDRVYGLETRGNTNFIVNSGISDWAVKFKTGTVAEFGVIDIS